MDYYEIPTWQNFQHYKDRDPPWIKLHFSLLTSPTWVMLDDASRSLAIACMLIASRNHGKVPADPAYIKRVAYLSSVDFKPLLSIGFLEPSSEMLASASTLQAKATTEKRREEKSKPPTPFEHVEGLNESAWESFLTYRKSVGKPIKSASINSARKALAKFGADQSAVVEQSIANGWQGLFPLKPESRSGEKVLSL